MAGLGRGDVDQTQAGASGDTKSSMWFLALRGSYKVQPIAGTPLDVTGRVSLLAGRKTVDAFALSDGTAVGESTANTRRLKPGVELAYTFDTAGAKVQPFVNADLIYDFKDEVNGDKQAFELGGGLRIASARDRPIGFAVHGPPVRPQGLQGLVGQRHGRLRLRPGRRQGEKPDGGPLHVGRSSTPRAARPWAAACVSPASPAASTAS